MRHALPGNDLPGPAWAPYAILVAAVAAAYANALGAQFQFDDWNVIVDEPRVRTLAAWWASMPGIRPLLKLSYALNFSLGSGPAGFHALNVALHAANAGLVFALFARRGARPLALAAALCFALHPVQTEAVTYVSGRSTSLMALFALASILAWMEGRRTVLSPALFAAALLVKESAVVVPLVIVLSELTSAARRRWPLGHIAVLGVAAVTALSSATYRHLFEVSVATRSVATNLITQAHAIAYLAGQTVRLDRLNADPALPVIDAWDVGVALEAAAILAVLALGVALLRSRPAISFALLWFFLWILPTNSLLPRLDVANDRQLYLALAGPAWLAARALDAAAARRGHALATALALVLAAILGVATHHRNRVYANEVVFWEDVARKSPENGRAFNNLGYALALAGRRAEADAALCRALELDPDDVRAAVNLRLLREGALTRRPGEQRAP